MLTCAGKPNIRDQVRFILQKNKAEQDAKLQNKVKTVVDSTVGKKEDDPDQWRKVTLQADKDIDYLTLKKVMYSIYEAGGGPINFAVAKNVEAEIDPPWASTMALTIASPNPAPSPLR